MKLSKCEIMQARVKFLGNIVGGGQIAPDPEKVGVLFRSERPKNLRELQSFIGLSNQYRRYIADFAKYAKPLYDLVGGHGVVSKRRNVKVLLENWTDEQIESFEWLRTAITSDKVLMLPNFDLEFVVTTDASDYAIGGVLSQLYEREKEKGVDDRPVAYFSKSMNEAQTRYSTTEKEMLAIVLAVENWHYSFTVDISPKN